MLSGDGSIVYVESNNPNHNKNAVLAFRQNPADGSLKELKSGPFLTGDTGVYNADERLGPDDSDQEVALSADHRFLLAVNQGSNTIAVFRIQHDGSLKLVHGAPFSSGGIQPVSIGISGDKVYVVNRGVGTPLFPGGAHSGASLNVFTLENDGSLVAVPGASRALPQDSSPTQALISPNGKLLFVDDLFALPFPPPPGLPPFAPAAGSQLESFKLAANGKPVPAPTSPVPTPIPPPFPPFMLGLAANPKHPVIYVGFVIAGALGAFSYDAAGNLTFASTAPTTGAAICWITVNKAGTFAYVANSASDSIGVFSLADPLHPVQVQDLPLKGPKLALPPGGAVGFTTTPFQLSLDPSGSFLYVVSHETTEANTFPNGNALHVLAVGRNGHLSETKGSPLILPVSEVPAKAHPQGIAILGSDYDGRDRAHGELFFSHASSAFAVHKSFDTVFSRRSDLFG